MLWKARQFDRLSSFPWIGRCGRQLGTKDPLRSLSAQRFPIDGRVMQPNITPIERAFQLARLGTFFQVTEIKEQLGREGYFTEVICGPTLHAQLNLAMEAARIARWTNATGRSVREPAERRKQQANGLTETQLEKMPLKRLLALQAKIKAAIDERRLSEDSLPKRSGVAGLVAP